MHGTLPAASTPRPPGPALALRLALREMRSGLSGFLVFVTCIALGVAAISGVTSVARSLVGGIADQGRTILGGDISLSITQREAAPDERRAFETAGQVSAVANFRGMANGNGNAALVEAKAVGAGYPQIGAIQTDPQASLADLLQERDGAFGAVADPALFSRLGLEPGGRVTVGSVTLELRARLVSEPDKLAAGIGFGPRLIMSEAALRASGLLQPGSLVRWSYRIVVPPGPDGTVDRALKAVQAAMPEAGAGWEIRTRDNADPRFSRNIDRFTQFLTLVGLTALLVGGVGVANAVSAFVDRKRVPIGILKSLGATGGFVVAVYLTQVLFIALIGVAIGIVVGAAMPFGIAAAFRSVLPIPIDPVVSPGSLATAAVYGLLTALAFSLAPLGRAHGITVAGLFRDRVAPDRRWPPACYVLAASACAALLVLLAIGAAYDSNVAAMFVAAAGGSFVLLRGIAALIMIGARALPRPRAPFLRLALANLHRPGALTPSLVLSLGLGITLLVTLATIDGSLRQELGRTLPERAPNFFFIDIQSTEADAFRTFLNQEAPGSVLESTAMMRGRITALNDIPVGDAKAAPNAAWVLEGDRGITYATTVPEGSTVVAGAWWPPDVSGPPLVSMDAEIARGLGLDVGDSVTVNVLGRSMKARIANLRRIDWRRIGIGFVLVFSPQSFAGAPHTELMTLTLPRGSDPAIEGKLVRDAARSFPSVTSVRVRDVLEAVDAVVAQLVFAIRAASSVALAASLLVLAGALAAGHRARLYDAVVLKTLGATRPRLLGAYLAEYGALGLVTALFGLLAGTAAGYGIVTRVMRLEFSPGWAGPLSAAALAVVVAVVLGLAGTWRVLGQKPARHLRSL